LHISQILQTFRAAACRVCGSAELLTQETDTPDNAETDILEDNFLGVSERCREGRHACNNNTSAATEIASPLSFAVAIC
jgi:hypothetical protein